MSRCRVKVVLRSGGGWIFDRMTGARSGMKSRFRVGGFSPTSGVSAACAGFVSVIGAPTTAERTMRASCRPPLIGQLLVGGRLC
jgi:hypothetical protein